MFGDISSYSIIPHPHASSTLPAAWDHEISSSQFKPHHRLKDFVYIFTRNCDRYHPLEHLILNSCSGFTTFLLICSKVYMVWACCTTQTHQVTFTGNNSRYCYYFFRHRCHQNNWNDPQLVPLYLWLLHRTAGWKLVNVSTHSTFINTILRGAGSNYSSDFSLFRVPYCPNVHQIINLAIDMWTCFIVCNVITNYD